MELLRRWIRLPFFDCKYFAYCFISVCILNYTAQAHSPPCRSVDFNPYAFFHVLLLSQASVPMCGRFWDFSPVTHIIHCRLRSRIPKINEICENQSFFLRVDTKISRNGRWSFFRGPVGKGENPHLPKLRSAGDLKLWCPMTRPAHTPTGPLLLKQL